MPKAKRSKGSKGSAAKKLANMSEEERIAYLQKQKLAEEEERKQKENVLLQFLKDKLGKEEKASVLNLSKINQQWRSIMRDVKGKELKVDIQILSQTFERIVDRKASAIKNLIQDLAEAEEQYCVALRAHQENLDNLVALQQQRLSRLRKEHSEELDMIKHEFDCEREQIGEQHNKDMSDLTEISFAIEQTFQEQESEAKADFQSMCDEVKNKSMEAKRALRVNLEKKASELWNQFLQASENYKNSTDDRQHAFEQCKATDEKSAREIELQMKKLQKIGDRIAMLKSRMASLAKENEEKNRELREDRERMTLLFHALKAQMSKIRDAQRKKLQELTVESSAALKGLSTRIEQGEQIEKAAEQCRKLETEEEKVLPFYVGSLTKEEEDDVMQSLLESPKEPMAAAALSYLGMDNFWKRVNKVGLDKAALEREKELLLSENNELRSLLKQYLEGISVNSEILSRENPLFVINHKTNFRMAVPLSDPRVHHKPVVIDSTQAVNPRQVRV